MPDRTVTKIYTFGDGSGSAPKQESDSSSKPFKIKSDVIMFAIFAIVVIALGFGAHSFLQFDQEITVQPGDTVRIPWEVVNDYGYFTKDRTVPYRIYADYNAPDGETWYADKDLRITHLRTDEHSNGIIELKIPNTPGVYSVTLQEFLKINGTMYDDSLWTSAGRYTVKMVVNNPSQNNSSQNNSSQNNSSQNNSSQNNSSQNNSSIVVVPDGEGNNIIEVPVVKLRLAAVTTGLLLLLAGGLFVVYLYMRKREKAMTGPKRNVGKTKRR